MFNLKSLMKKTLHVFIFTVLEESMRTGKSCFFGIGFTRNCKFIIHSGSKSPLNPTTRQILQSSLVATLLVATLLVATLPGRYAFWSLRFLVATLPGGYYNPDSSVFKNREYIESKTVRVEWLNKHRLYSF